VVVKGQLTDTSVVTAGAGVVSCQLAEGAALLDMRTGVYFTLNEVGANVWSTIQTPAPLSEILDNLLMRYEVDHDRCYDDVVSLLEQLDGAGLISIVEKARPQVPDPQRVG
jgi:hypothetical protein